MIVWSTVWILWRDFTWVTNTVSWSNVSAQISQLQGNLLLCLSVWASRTDLRPNLCWQMEQECSWSRSLWSERMCFFNFQAPPSGNSRAQWGHFRIFLQGRPPASLSLLFFTSVSGGLTSEWRFLFESLYWSFSLMNFSGDTLVLTVREAEASLFWSASICTIVFSSPGVVVSPLGPSAPAASLEESWK